MTWQYSSGDSFEKPPLANFECACGYTPHFQYRPDLPFSFSDVIFLVPLQKIVQMPFFDPARVAARS